MAKGYPYSDYKGVFPSIITVPKRDRDPRFPCLCSYKTGYISSKESKAPDATILFGRETT